MASFCSLSEKINKTSLATVHLFECNWSFPMKHIFPTPFYWNTYRNIAVSLPSFANPDFLTDELSCHPTRHFSRFWNRKWNVHSPAQSETKRLGWLAPQSHSTRLHFPRPVEHVECMLLILTPCWISEAHRSIYPAQTHFLLPKQNSPAAEKNAENVYVLTFCLSNILGASTQQGAHWLPSTQPSFLSVSTWVKTDLLTLNSSLCIWIENGWPCSLLGSITQLPSGIAPCKK